MVVLFLVFKEIFILFSIAAVSVYIPTMPEFVPSLDVQITSRKLMFIPLSQLTRCPLYVSPFLSSTNTGWFWAVFSSDKGCMVSAGTGLPSHFCHRRRRSRSAFLFYLQDVSHVYFHPPNHDYTHALSLLTFCTGFLTPTPPHSLICFSCCKAIWFSQRQISYHHVS